MAFYPLAKKKLIDPGPNDPPITPIGAILHVDAGNSPDLYDYFAHKSGGIESHFHIPKEGPVIQMRDTAYEADANLKGNSFWEMKNGVRTRRLGFISIETQGFAAGEWNDHQLENIKDLLWWLSDTHKFPLQVCKTPTTPGVGYHVMWGAPGPWTPVSKVCPGPDRVRQFENILVPWFKTQGPIGAGGTPGKEQDELANADEIKAELERLADAETARYSDLANRIQTLLTQEAARYQNYTGRFDKIDEQFARLFASEGSQETK